MSTDTHNYGLDLVDMVIPLIDEFIPNGFFGELPGQFDIRSPQAKIYFLTELIKIIRLFPLKVYTDSTKREQILSAAQSALDEMIVEEESQEMT